MNIESKLAYFVYGSWLEELVAGLYGFNVIEFDNVVTDTAVIIEIGHADYNQTDFSEISQDLSDYAGKTFFTESFDVYMRELIWFGYLPAGLYVI